MIIMIIITITITIQPNYIGCVGQLTKTCQKHPNGYNLLKSLSRGAFNWMLLRDILCWNTPNGSISWSKYPPGSNFTEIIIKGCILLLKQSRVSYSWNIPQDCFYGENSLQDTILLQSLLRGAFFYWNSSPKEVFYWSTTEECIWWLPCQTSDAALYGLTIL